MPSPNDNITLKDGLSAPYLLRAKDKSVAEDGSLQQVRHLAEPVSIDYGTGGAYRYTAKSGLMAAGLAASSPIFSMRNSAAARLIILSGVRVDAWTDSAAFAPGVMKFELFVARTFTVDDTGGNLADFSAPQAKLRTDMSAPQAIIRYSSTASLSPGTRTLDIAPADILMATAPVAAYQLATSKAGNRLIGGTPHDHPLVLAQDEGIVIAASVPAWGTWRFNVMPEWTEAPPTNY